MAIQFVTYLRVSTDKQGASGLGLEAQRAAVVKHAAISVGTITAEFVEVESGRKSDRPQLGAALAMCRATRSVLLIAKLDRLARNVHFVSGLMEAGVEFVAADMPTVTKLTIHILAAVAEEEARMISARTIAALTAAKARGVRLGNPNLQAGTRATAQTATDAKTAQAHQRAVNVLPYIIAAKKAGAATLSQVAEALTARGVATPTGRGIWTPCAVSRVVAHAA